MLPQLSRISIRPSRLLKECAMKVNQGLLTALCFVLLHIRAKHVTFFRVWPKVQLVSYPITVLFARSFAMSQWISVFECLALEDKARIANSATSLVYRAQLT